MAGIARSRPLFFTTPTEQRQRGVSDENVTSSRDDGARAPRRPGARRTPGRRRAAIRQPCAAALVRPPAPLPTRSAEVPAGAGATSRPAVLVARGSDGLSTGAAAAGSVGVGVEAWGSAGVGLSAAGSAGVGVAPQPAVRLASAWGPRAAMAALRSLPQNSDRCDASRLSTSLPCRPTRSRLPSRIHALRGQS